MAILLEDFIKPFLRSENRKVLSKSVLPIDDESLTDRNLWKSFLERLLVDVNKGQYFPSVPRGEVVYNRKNGVPRFVPALSIRDICVFYYCISTLEGWLAINRVRGTYGGWRMSKVLQSAEQGEILDLPNSAYYFASALDPIAWSRQWKDFQKLAFQWSATGDFEYFLKFDIANFYDNINLDRLERKVRHAVPPTYSSTIDLLFVFLRYWNRTNEGYSPSLLEFHRMNRQIAHEFWPTSISRTTI